MKKRLFQGRKEGGGDSKKESLLAYKFLLPLVLVLLLFMLYPLIYGFGLSIRDEAGRFVGTKNFMLLFREPRFWVNLKLTVVYVVVSVSAIISLGLLAAHLITEKSRFISFIRPLYLIPWLIPNAASGILFKTLLDGNSGPIPLLYKSLTGNMIMPLANMKLSLWVVIFHEFWRGFPFAMLFLAAGLTTISRDVYEAATIDGAGKWRQFVSITLPLIKNHLFIVILLITNSTLQSSENIYSLTMGGPGYATETIGVRMFKTAFVYNEYNSGAATGVLLLVIALIFMFLYSRVLKTQEEESYE